MCHRCGSFSPEAYLKQKESAEAQRKEANKAMWINIGITTLGELSLSLIGNLLNGSNNDKEEYTYTSTRIKTKTDPADDNLDDNQIKEKIQNFLENKITNLNDEILNELVDKYKKIKENDPSISDEMLGLRLHNYVRGKANAQHMVNYDILTNGVMDTLGEYDNPDILTGLNDIKNDEEAIDLTASDGSDNISLDKLRDLSMSFLEFHDLDDDKSIDLLEFFKKDLIKHYQAFDNQTMQEATIMVENKLTELKIKNVDDLLELARKIDPTSDKVTQEEMVLYKSVMQFTKLNVNPDNNISLDSNEIMAYFASVANFNTIDNKLDVADLYDFNNSILSGKKYVNNSIDYGEAVDFWLNTYYNAITKKNQ
ncbi:hypothetical protein IKB17_03000 [bacterium]|nr:hypothetical protein [bacterium]